MNNLTNIIGSEKGNEGRDNPSNPDNNPILLAEEITKRLKAEERNKEILSKKGKIEPKVNIPEDTTPEIIDKNVPTIYIPGIRLYISEKTYLHGKSWEEATKILHANKIRMPTLLEQIEILKYLSSAEGQFNCDSALSTYQDIIYGNNSLKGEFLDARIRTHRGVSQDYLYHRFAYYDEITHVEECMPYLLKNVEQHKCKDGINLDFWLKDDLKQGLPRPCNLDGTMGYIPPRRKNSVVVLSTENKYAILNCNYTIDFKNSYIGVRYLMDSNSVPPRQRKK